MLGFGGEWPYSKPFFVLSNTLGSLPANQEDNAELVDGTIEEVLQKLNERGFRKLYIDGGKLIQSFLKADLIDELIISRVPIVLDGGIPLFGSLSSQLGFEHLSTRVLLDAIVQSHYRRMRRVYDFGSGGTIRAIISCGW